MKLVTLHKAIKTIGFSWGEWCMECRTSNAKGQGRVWGVATWGASLVVELPFRRSVLRRERADS